MIVTTRVLVSSKINIVSNHKCAVLYAQLAGLYGTHTHARFCKEASLEQYKPFDKVMSKDPWTQLNESLMQNTILTEIECLNNKLITCSCLLIPNAAANLKKRECHFLILLLTLNINCYLKWKDDHVLYLSPLCPIVSPVENSATAGNWEQQWNDTKFDV